MTILVQWNLDLRKPEVRKNLDLRKIVPTTKILEHRLFDFRKIFNSSPSMTLMSSSEKSYGAAIQIDLDLRNCN